MISFTFDDFPRSACTVGAEILGEWGVRATYYASLGLMGKTTPTGDIFLAEDLPVLLDRGHELGCHTFSHCPAYETPPGDFDAAVEENGRVLDRLCPGERFRTLSYPISNPRPATKRLCQRRFLACRAGGQTFNHGAVDLNALNAFFIEQSRADPSALLAVIDRTVEACGWLILATHDVSETPTRFGCTPDLFRRLTRHAVASGAAVLPVAEALSVGHLLDRPR